MAVKERHIIPIARPWLGEEEAQATQRAILSGWVTQGPEVAAFEREFAACMGAPYACAVSNCTTALHLALRAVGVQPGDEVITVSHSFIATASSVRYCGALPVFIDIDPATFNLNPEHIARAISPRTKAILCVHQVGMPCDLRAILELAQRHALPVIEDAACAIGSEILWDGRWEKIGKPHGTVACFSFHPRKLITTGDGGMLTTSDAALNRKFRLWRQHSMDVSDTSRHAANQVTFESYPELGFNYRMTDIQAAVGRVQLSRLPELITRRRYLADRYRTLLANISTLIPPAEGPGMRTNWQSYIVRLPENTNQREVMQFMMDRGVSTRRGIMCAHREHAYAAPDSWRCGYPGCSRSCAHLHESEVAQDSTLILPLYHQMTEADQDTVVAALQQALLSQQAAPNLAVTQLRPCG